MHPNSNKAIHSGRTYQKSAGLNGLAERGV